MHLKPSPRSQVRKAHSPKLPLRASRNALEPRGEESKRNPRPEVEVLSATKKSRKKSFGRLSQGRFGGPPGTCSFIPQAFTAFHSSFSNVKPPNPPSKPPIQVDLSYANEHKAHCPPKIAQNSKKQRYWEKCTKGNCTPFLAVRS